MGNEITKYKNELNTIAFKQFNSRELNLFFSIVSRMRDKNTEKVTFSFQELHSLSNSDQHSKRFINDLKNTYQKMLQLGISHGDDHHIKAWVLFTTFDIDIDNKEVSIRVNPDLRYILNDFTIETHWTRFSLQQFTNLHSTYAKNAFRLFKQFRTLGVVKYTKEEFLRLLSIPKSYKPIDIDRRVLHPIIEELSPIFKNLKVTKNHGKGRGNPIIGYQFTFTPEDKDKDDFNVDTINDRKEHINNIFQNKNLSVNDKISAIKRYSNDHPLLIKKGTDKDELSQIILALIDEYNIWQQLLKQTKNNDFILEKSNEILNKINDYQKRLLNFHWVKIDYNCWYINDFCS